MKLCHRSCIWLESEGWRLYSRPRAQFFPIWTNLDWERLVFSSWFAFFLPFPDWCGDDSQPRLMGFESMISQSHLRSLIATLWDASGKKFKPIPINIGSLLREFWSGFIEKNLSDRCSQLEHREESQGTNRVKTKKLPVALDSMGHKIAYGFTFFMWLVWTFRQVFRPIKEKTEAKSNAFPDNFSHQIWIVLFFMPPMHSLIY